MHKQQLKQIVDAASQVPPPLPCKPPNCDGASQRYHPSPNPSPHACLLAGFYLRLARAWAVRQGLPARACEDLLGHRASQLRRQGEGGSCQWPRASCCLNASRVAATHAFTYPSTLRLEPILSLHLFIQPPAPLSHSAGLHTKQMSFALLLFPPTFPAPPSLSPLSCVNMLCL